MIELYADGACFPNPGNMAIGVVLIWNGRVKEHSEEIGKGTNNVAELTAIKTGLQMIKKRDIPVTIISDSQYALNCLKGNWNPSKNTDLIKEIQTIISEFETVHFKWARGHSGNKWNERADELSNQFFSNGYYL
jgi:ribonuclease HI